MSDSQDKIIYYSRNIFFSVLFALVSVLTFSWFCWSILDLFKVGENFKLKQDIYKSSLTLELRKETSSISDKDKSDILYNYYSILTYLGNSAILAATLLVTEFSLFAAYLWDRKRKAFDSLAATTSGEFLKNRIVLENGFNINPYFACHKYNTHNYLVDRVRIPSRKKILVRDIFNVFDMICTGIKHHIIDEDLAYDQLRMIMRAYWQWGKSYILLARMLHVDSDDPDRHSARNH